MHILSDGILRSFSFSFSITNSLLNYNHITSSFSDFFFNCILYQQMAQDTLISKPHSPTECCICSGQFSPIRNVRPFDHEEVQIGVKYQIQVFALHKNLQ